MKNFMFVFLILGIISCSSDDSIDIGPEPQPIAETKTGIFRDSEVAGLKYETETKSGVTDANGNFEYLEGETVTFYVGDILIGSGPASEDMTPISIAATPNATISSPEVKNIAAFLQTLDSDNDASNGITINQETIAAISVNAIDFTQPIIGILGEIVAEVNLANATFLEVVYPEEATVHLAATTGETYVPEIDVFNTFIPTLESWKPYPSTSVYWIHETDDNGNLLNSTMFEKYPERILYKIEYPELMENGLPSKYMRTYYNFGEVTNVVNVEVTYNEDNTVAEFYITNADGSFNRQIRFNSLDDKKRVVEASYYSETDEFIIRNVYDLLANGNNSEIIRYSSESGNDESSIQFINKYTYTNFGEIESQTIDNKTNNLDPSTWYYSYTEAKTLKTRERNSIGSDNRARSDKYFYDAEERIERILIEEGDYVSDYVEFFPNGKYKRVETYFQGFLYEIIEWAGAEDRTSIWTTINEDDGSYIVEYKDENEVTYKTEYYDADGNLTSTS